MIRSLCVLIAIVCTAGAARAQGLAPEDILGQDREITLQDAVALALEYNLGLQLERNEPALARERVREYWGLYEPAVVAAYDRAHVETPLASSVQSFFGTSGDRTTDDLYSYNGGFRGILPWGLAYSSGYTIQRLDTTSSFTSLGPQYTADWTTTLAVPLLRGLYWSPADLLVRRSHVQQQLTDENFRARLSDTVALVEAGYWDLAAARALERAAKKSVDTAVDLLEQTKVQYQVGVVSKVRVTEAEAGVAQREFDHISALNLAQRAQDRLLTAILSPNITDYSNTTLRTVVPTFVPYEVDAEQALEKARALRPELVVAQKLVEDAELNERYSWNQKLPALDLVGSWSNQGLAGEQKIPAGTPLGFRDDPNTPGFQDDADPTTPAIDPARQIDFGFPRGRWGADNDFFDASGEHSWSVSAIFEYPIGNDTADARHVQRKIELRRARTNLRRTEQDVIVDVRGSVRELKSSIDRVKAAQRARIASEETLRAEQERLRLGDSTPHLVLDFEEDLLRAESNEITALQVYYTAISALERAQGTILESRGISIDTELERGMSEY